MSKKTKSPVFKKTKIGKMLTFPEAILGILAGKKLTKLEWDDPRTYIFLHNDRLVIHSSKESDDIHRPLLVSKEDMEGEDWIVIQKQKAMLN